MKLQYYIVVNVVIHISKSKGVAEMTNKANKIKKKGGFLRLQVDDSSRLFIPCGSNVLPKSIKNDSLAFLIESWDEWIISTGISCMSVWQ